jgi:PBP1b-binding outer membrane lipoprotein LpoB
MMMRIIMLISMVLLVMGCESKPAHPSASSKASAEITKSPLDTLVMLQKPANPLSVTEAMKKKAGEVVLVTGQVPPEKVKPYNPAVAAFVMLDPISLAKEEVKEEFDCDDAAT